MEQQGLGAVIARYRDIPNPTSAETQQMMNTLAIHGYHMPAAVPSTSTAPMDVDSMNGTKDENDNMTHDRPDQSGDDTYPRLQHFGLHRVPAGRIIRKWAPLKPRPAVPVPSTSATSGCGAAPGPVQIPAIFLPAAETTVYGTTEGLKKPRKAIRMGVRALEPRNFPSRDSDAESVDSGMISGADSVCSADESDDRLDAYEGPFVPPVNLNTVLAPPSSVSTGGFIGNAADASVSDRQVKRVLDDLRDEHDALHTTVTRIIDLLLDANLQSLESPGNQPNVMMLGEMVDDLRDMKGSGCRAAVPEVAEASGSGPGTSQLPSWDAMVNFVREEGIRMFQIVKKAQGKEVKNIGWYKLAGWLQKVATENLYVLKEKCTAFLPAAFWDTVVSTKKGRNSNNRASQMIMDKLLQRQIPSSAERMTEGEKFVKAMYLIILWKKTRTTSA